MISMDCTECPSGERGCDECVVPFLLGENPQVDELSSESCGYVLASDVRSAIEVLRAAGMVSRVEIMAVEPAA